MSGLRIGLMGEIPPLLGGAGLELQLERTVGALRRAGHEPLMVASAERDARIDVLHAFGSEPAVWHHLRHWTRNRAPLVVTSVVVVSPGREERAMRLSARLPAVLTSTRMRVEVLHSADAVVAGTEYERGLLTRGLRVSAGRVIVVGNGADPVAPGPPPDALPSGYALLVGAVSERKGQARVLRALQGSAPVVVVGAYAGAPDGREQWQRTVSDTGATWLGQVDGGPAMSALRDGALALVHLSGAEVQSLAVLEALAQGTPAVLSDIPSHRELHAEHPALVSIVDGPEGVPAALEELRHAERPGPAPIPTWDDVARRLVGVYGDLLAREGGTA